MANTKENIDSLYLKEIMQIPLLSVEEERELSKRMALGDGVAKQKLIESNLRLVVSIANRYINTGIPFLDLISEGNLALIKATEKYDINRGVKFATYATYWINKYLFNYLAANDKQVSIPVVSYYKNGKYRKCIENLAKKLNHTPSIKEIANELSISELEIKKITKVNEFNMISIDELINEDSDNSLEAILSNLETPLEEIIIDSTLKDYFEKIFDNCQLKSIEKTVLKLKNGFKNGRIYNNAEIGKMYNLTRQRIYQIEEEALEKIRTSDHVFDLLPYAENQKTATKKIYTYRKYYREKKLKKKYPGCHFY